jgi:hypothetical protein
VDAHFEYKAMDLVNPVRVAVRLASLIALPCRILDHLLCPLCICGVVAKHRRHSGQGKVRETRGARMSGRMLRANDAIIVEFSETGW